MAGGALRGEGERGKEHLSYRELSGPMSLRQASSDAFLLRSANLPSNTAYTIMLWAKLLAAPIDIVGLIYRNNGAGDSAWVGLYWNPNEGNKLSIDSTAVGQTLGALHPMGDWMHIALRRVNNTFTVFKDGFPYLEITDGSAMTNSRLYLCSSDFQTGRTMTAEYAACKIFNASLRDQDIRREMQQVSPARTADVESWYPFLGRGTVSGVGSGPAWTVTSTLATAETFPPIPWTIRNRKSEFRQYAVQGGVPQFFARSRRERPPYVSQGGVGTTLLTIAPAYLEWQAQGGLLPRTVPIQPGRLQWQGQVMALRRTLLLSPSWMQWQAQTAQIGGLVRITPAQFQWQAQVLIRRGKGSRGYALGVQRGYPRRQAVIA